MSRISKSILLTGLSVLALGACSSDKGPGDLGSKDDIVVRNNGMPGAQQQAAKAEGEDFTSTVEQAEAAPAPEVTSAEPLPDNSPATKEAVEQQQATNAPLQSTPATTTAPAATEPAPAVIPPTPQSAPSATAPAPVAQAPAQVATQVPAPVTTTEPEPATLAPGVKYPLDPNAPYSPKAVAAANAAATTTAATAPAAGVPNMTDPATIKAAQTALKAKGGYSGAESGEIDANFLNALTVYQGQNGLAQGGLNEDTLRNLGVIQ